MLLQLVVLINNFILLCFPRILFHNNSLRIVNVAIILLYYLCAMD